MQRYRTNKCDNTELGKKTKSNNIKLEKYDMELSNTIIQNQ